MEGWHERDMHINQPSPLFLSKEEIFDLTGKERPTAQIKVLNALGLNYQQRPDGRLLILRNAVEEIFGVRNRDKSRQQQPNWSACRG